jgi:hypothetical protein
MTFFHFNGSDRPNADVRIYSFTTPHNKDSSPMYIIIWHKSLMHHA